MIGAYIKKRPNGAFLRIKGDIKMSVNAKRNGTLVGGLLIMLCVGILYM